MKISNSKKQLAKIISENGGWFDGAEFAWFGNLTNKCLFGRTAPRYDAKIKSLRAFRSDLIGEFPCGKIPNWHQTVLAHDEYFHLYPAPDADHSEDSLDMVEPNPAPTIEQLAAEYRNRQDYAERKQKEADAAKAEAEAALSRLIIACADLGLEIKPKGKLESSGASVIDKLQYKASALAGSGLNITDWRDLLVGDVVWISDGDSRLPSGEYEIDSLADDELQPFMIRWDGKPWWPNTQRRDWRFIRRP